MGLRDHKFIQLKDLTGKKKLKGLCANKPKGGKVKTSKLELFKLTPNKYFSLHKY